MKQVSLVTSALRRVLPQGLLVAGLLIGSSALNASTGTDHGYWWQNYWVGGSSNLTFPSAGTYAGNWQDQYSNVSDVVAGKGWNPGTTRTLNYNAGVISGSYNNFGAYGWTTNPLIEYYVCDKGSVATGSSYGSLSSDGHSYQVYQHQQVNQPSIQGTATFWQYLSNWGGTSTGANHAITLSNHINFWKAHLGHGFGAYNLQINQIEAWGNRSGTTNSTVW